MSAFHRIAAPVAIVLSLAALPAWAGDESVTVKPSGRLHYDFARFDNDGRGSANRDDQDLRAAWLAISGRFFAVDYKLEADFAGDEVIARDVYLTRKFAAGTLTVGQFKQFYTLDDRGSSNHISLVERSYLAQALAPTYRLGVGFNGDRNGVFWSASAYSLESIDVWQTKGRAFGVRAGYAPLREEGRVLHLGGALAHERYDHPGADGASALRVRPRIAGYFGDNSRLTLVDFSSGRDVDVDKYGLELATVHGPLSLQAEYGGARFDDGSQRGDIRSGYLQATWLLTGESRPYDARAGRFVQLKPQRASGAWELALRYDRIDGEQRLNGLPDFRDVQGEAYSVGVNWYARKHFRVMLDWTDSCNYDQLAARTLDHTRTLAGRLQFDF
ncbi:OprO/OprP family phosphate-selective porin [Pseudoxanthomonas wuyuanensis]|uniref:Phosphate-selective porin OprO and OprP n=1 Tax=Pseudoxanthomonas wuyuanensis TaxID=1073196 RepID=A0A286DAI0_9GAMM|nr:porin [Pseudoxanthomonas wuyuanensis]KAF1720573.1 porin [Pseudoxanthomonas wuyuanensis]SOD55644.1 phosphate-selective porin OprO and OprP [Pseudoxanthomonas wuyuanensis]